ncbi:MAG: PAS domain S-box protein, partial [Chloroflexales bacterium]|nr:PAS domain S-box protein [Chloroflexales bacterium]
MTDPPHQAGHEATPQPSGGGFAPSELLRYVQDAVIAADPALRITSWNPAAEALYGWSAADVIGRPSPEILHTEYVEVEVAQVLQQLRAQGVWKGEVIQRHKDGRPLLILAAVSQVRGPDGEPSGLVTVNRDIGERKAAEAELRAYAARLEVLTEASRAFAATSMGTDALLDLIARHLAEAPGCACTIVLRSDDGHLLLPVTAHDIDLEALALIRAIFAAHPIPIESQHPVAHVFRSGSPLLIPTIDPEQLRARLQPEYWPAIDRFQVSSAVLAPLQVEGRSLGVLGLTRRQQLRPAFTDQDLQLAQNLADRAAVALANAHLYQQLQDERALLARWVAERTADLSL